MVLDLIPNKQMKNVIPLTTLCCFVDDTIE